MKNEAINYCQTRLKGDLERVFESGTKTQKSAGLLLMLTWGIYKWLKGIK